MNARKPMLTPEQIAALPEPKRTEITAMAADYEIIMNKLEEAVASKDQHQIEALKEIVADFRKKYGKV